MNTALIPNANTQMDHSIYIALGIADEFNLEPTAFIEIAEFWDTKTGITEDAIRELFSQARRLGLEWHNLQTLMKYIKSEQPLRTSKMIGALEIVRSAMAIAEYFHVGSREVLRYINLFSKYKPFRVRVEFIRVFNQDSERNFSWSEICRRIMTDESVKQQAIKILHSNFL